VNSIPGLYFAYTLTLTVLAIMSTTALTDCRVAEPTSISSCLSEDDRAFEVGYIFVYCVTGAGVVALLVRELIQAVANFKGYVKDHENWLELILIVLTGAYLIALHLQPSISPHFGALATLLSWMLFTLLLGRFPSIGIYIYMSVHVTKLLVAFLLFFSSVMFGFALAFHMLLPNHTPFDNMFTSIFKVLVMMSGEFEFESNFLWDAVEGKGSNGTTQFVFLLFFFTVSIVISNLIIGLTVNETEILFKTAGAMRMQKTLLQIIGLENIYIKETALPRHAPEGLRKRMIRGTQGGRIRRLFKLLVLGLTAKTKILTYSYRVALGEQRPRIMALYQLVSIFRVFQKSLPSL
jgi:hypothetical protein